MTSQTASFPIPTPRLVDSGWWDGKRRPPPPEVVACAAAFLRAMCTEATPTLAHCPADVQRVVRRGFASAQSAALVAVNTTLAPAAGGAARDRRVHVHAVCVVRRGASSTKLFLNPAP